MDKWDSLQALTAAMVETIRAYDSTGVKTWDGRIALQDLAYQVGGLQKLCMQLNNERHLQGKTLEDVKADIEIELAEVIGVALFAAKDLGVDVRKGFQRMLETDMNKIAERRAALKK